IEARAGEVRHLAVEPEGCATEIGDRHRDADFRGATFRFDGEVTNLSSTGFNDAISSLELRGDWEVCTDAYFRGQCVVLRDDVGNLRNTGMNDRISSMRPVGRGGRR
ncbi:MAG: hypothetical protein EON90_14485, partial [Brevundimonas sp.]